jgi:hypothetical protein
MPVSPKTGLAVSKPNPLSDLYNNLLVRFTTFAKSETSNLMQAQASPGGKTLNVRGVISIKSF